MATLNIKPLADRVLVEPLEAETKTASGIIIPDSAKEKPQQGVVIAVGAGKKDEPMTVKVGDKVEKNQTLVTIEAMKMETAVTARMSGTIASVEVREGDTVKGGQLLLTIQ